MWLDYRGVHGTLGPYAYTTLRQGRRVVKMCFYFTMEFRNYLELASVSVGIKTCPAEYATNALSSNSEIFEKLDIGVHVLQTNNAGFGLFMLLFCITICAFIAIVLLYFTFCLVTFSSPLPSCFAQGPL